MSVIIHTILDRNFTLLMIMCVNCNIAFGQAKTGVENYTAFRAGESLVWMPVAHHTGKQGLYGEIRYNYEALKTASAYLGKNITGEKIVSYSFTPMVGMVFGNYNGISTALKTGLQYKKISLSADLQYTSGINESAPDFFYSWSELTCDLRSWAYAGISLQQTRLYKDRMISEAGIVMAFIINKVTIPLYIFSPLNNHRNVILGMNLEW